MNISVSDEMHRIILHRVRTGGHSTVSEYIRSLVRRDRQEKPAPPPAPQPVAQTMNEWIRMASEDE